MFTLYFSKHEHEYIIKRQVKTVMASLSNCGGFAEMLKHGLITDKTYWHTLTHLEDLDISDLDKLIYDSVVIKNNIVMQDPTEKGLRKTLNFGHTLGHAIESYLLTHETKNALLHGEAIAVGMILATFISFKLFKQSLLDEYDRLIMEQAIYFRSMKCFDILQDQELKSFIQKIKFRRNFSVLLIKCDTKSDLKINITS